MNEQDIESLKEWAEMARLLELELGLSLLAKGHQPLEVLEKFSYRLTQKILHPLIQYHFTMTDNEYNSEQSQGGYQKNYTDRFRPAADHVVGDE